MTLKRKVYLRKKENKFTFETKIKGNSVYLIGLPTNYEKFLKDMCRLLNGLCPDCQKLVKSSFFNPQKWLEIYKKLASADTCLTKEEKGVY